MAANEPFYSSILNFEKPHRFALTYETGIDKFSRSDAHLAVNGRTKTGSIEYDTPYIKGLPGKVRVQRRMMRRR